MKILISISALALFLCDAVCFAAAKLDVSQLKDVPKGKYVMTLEIEGKQVRANLEVQNNRAKCVNSSDVRLKNMEGEFRRHPRQGGVFAISFRTEGGTMTQVWIFRPDGAAAIRENPDRGEQQRACPSENSPTERLLLIDSLNLSTAAFPPVGTVQTASCLLLFRWRGRLRPLVRAVGDPA